MGFFANKQKQDQEIIAGMVSRARTWTVDKLKKGLVRNNNRAILGVVGMAAGIIGTVATMGTLPALGFFMFSLASVAFNKVALLKSHVLSTALAEKNVTPVFQGPLGYKVSFKPLTPDFDKAANGQTVPTASATSTNTYKASGPGTPK